MKTAIVTGASRGIGLEICKQLEKLNYNVIGLSRNAESRYVTYSCDVGDSSSVKYVANKIKKNNKEIQVLVNAAGIASMNLALLTPSSLNEKLMQTNYIGTVNSCREFGSLLLRTSNSSIINFSSIAVNLGLKGESAYVASKAAVEAYSFVISKELAPHGVRVNCISPGPIKTSLLSGVSETQIEEIINRQIIKKIFSTSDICDIVSLLIDERAGSLTGQVFHVGGVS